jgi:hypothetical protein
MKTWSCALLIAGLVAVVGCNTSPTGGGNPTSPAQPSKNPLSSKPDTFTLKGPETLTAHTVKHGSNQTFDITVDKGRDFKEDIHFTAHVDPADKGVKADVEPKAWTAAGPNTVKVSVSVDDKAPAGNYKVYVTGKPAVGTETAVHFDVKVPEKK